MNFKSAKLITMAVVLLCATLSVSAANFSAPVAGRIYRIWNAGYGNVMYETASHQLNAKSYSATDMSDYSDLFLVESRSGTSGGFTLRNVGTGRYVQSVSANETPYTTGFSPMTVQIILNEKHNADSTSKAQCYNIFLAGTASCLHEAGDRTRVVRWNPTSAVTNNYPSEWRFEEVEQNDAMKTSLAANQMPVTGVYRIVNNQRHQGADWYAYEDGNKGLIIQQNKNTDGFGQLFLLRNTADGKYSIQNLASGGYVQSVDANNTAYTTGYSAHSFTVSPWTRDGGHTYYNIYNVSATDQWGWHADSQDKIVRWTPSGGSTPSASEWKLEAVTSYTDDAIKAQVTKALGASLQPLANHYYRVVSLEYGSVMTANTVTRHVNTSSELANQYLQLWKLVQLDNNAYTLQNVVTEEYVGNVGNNSGYYTTSTQKPQNGFNLVANSADPYTPAYEFIDRLNTGTGIHCAASQGYEAVRWTAGSAANRWMLKEVTLNDSILNSQKTAYQHVKALKANVDNYQTQLLTFYTDSAMTNLMSNYKTMETSALKNQMSAAGLPKEFVDMTVKIKDNGWKRYHSGKNWEQQFRIASYEPFSDYRRWSERMGIGYQMGSMFGPTGITVKKDSVLFIFVEKVPANATMECEIIPLGTKNGNITSLKSGLNIVTASQDGNLFMRYIADTYDTTKQTTLAHFPSVRVHVEGGEVCGYFDVVKGMTNDDWAKMVSDGLVTNSRSFDMRTKSVVLHADAEHVKTGCSANDIVEMLGVWEFVVSHEEKLMGFRDKWKDRCNCVMNATAVASGLYASTGGTYYGYYAWPGELAKYSVLNTGAGKLWAPGHEFGHNHQKLINMAGMTEISNNLFSNQIIFEYGKSTSRGGGQESAVSTIARKHAAKTFWPDYGTWGCTQMYYKLYLYYHAAKNDTTFFPRLFAELQRHPMTRRAMGVNRVFTYGDEDYLRFALTASKVANEDLTDFFEYYGFFVPVEDRVIGDYSNYRMHTSQAMIDSVKTEMHKLPNKGAAQNLIFISDHIRRSPSMAKDAKQGEMRQDYTGEDAVGKQGDFGQWEDFKEGSQLAPQGSISYAVLNADSTVTYRVDGTNNGVVGLKIYDQRDSLVYIANSKTFTLPKAVAKACGMRPVVKLAGANGTDVTVSTGDDILGGNNGFMVSSKGNEHWYYLQFAASGNVLATNGNGNNVVTAVAKATKTESQLWKAVWSADHSHYYFVSKGGLKLKLSGNISDTSNNNRFKATSTDSTALILFPSKNTQYPGSYEISTDSTAANAMNQVGILQAGQQIGVWNTGNVNNVLRYVPADRMGFSVNLPESSTAQHPVWYYIQFQSGSKLVLAGNGDQQPVVITADTHQNKDSKLWRFEKQSNGQYIIVNKLGQQLYITTSTASDNHHQVNAAKTPGDTKVFWITETYVNGNGFEISTSTATGKNYFNQYQGATEGHNVALWTQGDDGNCLQFIPEGEMIDVTGATSYAHDNRYTLWYNKPATTWMTSCLPIGDGQFGATIMGQVLNDNVQFNDKTLWTGKVGALVDHANYGKYLNFGSLNIHTDNAKDATGYVRYLDINNAVAGVNYQMGDVDYQRTYIASHPDSVVVIRYTAGRDGMINATLTMDGANGSITNYTVLNGQGRITFAGNIARTNNSGAAKPEAYMAEARVVISGGALSCKGQNIKVTGANTMTVYLRGLTNFDPKAAEYVSDASLVEPRLISIINKAVAKDYNTLLNGHTADYKRLFDRCQLTLAQPVTTTTDSLISSYASDQETNRFLEELYFNYGRYLLISSSRGVALPANLQGIWNNDNNAAWGSDIHANINVQMNYWPAEPTNLSELHMPMLDWIYREAMVKPQWRANAKAIGGVSTGWTLTTENNIYGSGSNWKSNYTIANAWLASHLWQHYEYTQDRAFLRDKALPVMKSCADYWLSKLKKNTTDGTYECPNEWSPEHGPDSENATAHSQQLVWDLFNSTLKAISTLGLTDAKVDSAYIKKLKNHFDSLDNGCHTEQISGKTYLREWKKTNQTAYDWTTHRHISHLMGLYPLSQIGKEMDSAVYEAAKNSLYARGMEGTGWSLGHKLNLMARVDDGEKCHQLIKNALRKTSTTSVQMSGHGGVYENLWDSHSPYQIDGNFGYTSGIAEMLLQSRFGKLEILPALPTKHWTSGSVTGLRAVGNFTVDIIWQDTVATQVAVTSGSGLPCTVKYKNAAHFKVTTAGGTVINPTANGNDEITFNTTVGMKYLLDMNMTDVETGTAMNAADFQVVNVSDEETTDEWAPAEQALDASATTFWHSRYHGSQTGYPHVLTLRHNANGTINSIKLTNTRGTNYHAKYVTVEQSTDGVQFETVASHKLLNRASVNVVRLDKPATQRFVRLIFEEGYDNSKLMTLNDVAFYGSQTSADTLFKMPMTYVASSDAETVREHGEASKAVDGNETTLWHSNYNGSETAYPHSITLQNTTRDAMKYIRLVQRPDKTGQGSYSHTKYDAAEVRVYAGATQETMSVVDTLRIPFYSTTTVALKRPLTDKFVKLEFTRAQEKDSKLLAIHEISCFANEMPVRVSHYGYATFFHNRAVIVPAGVQATTVGYENGALKFDYQYQPGQTIPANTGVMLKAAEGSYMFKYSADDSPAPAGNYMKGSVNDTTVTGNGKYYKLSTNINKDPWSFGFYYDNVDGRSMRNPAHKGYLFFPATVAAKLPVSFVINDGVATGIENAETTRQENVEIYDVSGRYIGRGTHNLPAGVYIQGGKKIVVK